MNRLPFTACLGVAVALCSGATLGQSAAPPPQPGLDGSALRDRASQLKSRAEDRFLRDSAECRTKVLVSSCIESARDRRTESLHEAKRIDHEGRALQAEAARRDKEAKEAQKAVEAPAQQAERQAREDRYRESEARRQAERKAKRESEQEREAQDHAKAAASDDVRRKKQARALALPAPNTSASESIEERKRKAAERQAKVDARKRDYAALLKKREAEKAAQVAADDAAAKAERTRWPNCLVTKTCAERAP